MDETAFLRRTLRIYRVAFRELEELARGSDSWIAQRVRAVLDGSQAKVERLKPLAPASLLPEQARARDHTRPLEVFP